MRINEDTHAVHSARQVHDTMPGTNPRRWITPSHPGRGKKPWLAFALGFLLGPVGIGLYLRSLMDALLLLCIDLVLFTIGGDDIAPIMWLVGGLWGFVRVRIDSREPAEVIESSETPSHSEAQRQPSSPSA